MTTVDCGLTIQNPRLGALNSRVMLALSAFVSGKEMTAPQLVVDEKTYHHTACNIGVCAALPSLRM